MPGKVGQAKADLPLAPSVARGGGIYIFKRTGRDHHRVICIAAIVGVQKLPAGIFKIRDGGGKAEGDIVKCEVVVAFHSPDCIEIAPGSFQFRAEGAGLLIRVGIRGCIRNGLFPVNASSVTLGGGFVCSRVFFLCHGNFRGGGHTCVCIF